MQKSFSKKVKKLNSTGQGSLVLTTAVLFELLGHQLMNDTTIEERVAVLEFQVSALTDDVTDLGEDVNLVEAEQLIQDEKILELQIDAEG